MATFRFTAAPSEQIWLQNGLRNHTETAVTFGECCRADLTRRSFNPGDFFVFASAMDFGLNILIPSLQTRISSLTPPNT